ncbi:hypothetical protein GCM10008904_14350 [Paraclostridium ghonii]|uniref:Transcriptional regulator n=1 Tax=Paraclostridium ghonii TaxID=29358 RepID=A0ABU0N0Q0_9FIRM|nr:hypothetical protein [Paeniclostridium ghonii]MDQ0556448.1 putative transcriptional regulator [Paeniclostridium ghonii]
MKNEFINNLELLKENNELRFTFVTELIKNVVSKNSKDIKIRLSITKQAIGVNIGNYTYDETFDTIEKLHKIVELLMCLKQSA